jgi:hypothetical protein
MEWFSGYLILFLNTKHVESLVEEKYAQKQWFIELQPGLSELQTVCVRLQPSPSELQMIRV